MKIAIFTETFYPEMNGVVTSILNSVDRLQKRGHTILIAAPMQKEKIKLPGVKFAYFKCRPLPTYKEYKIVYPNLSKALKVISAFRPDIIHVQNPMILGFLGIQAAKHYGIPVVATYHTKIDDFLKYISLRYALGISKGFNQKYVLKNKVAWAIMKRIYNRCNLTTTPSHTMRKELIKHGFKNVKTLSNGIDISLFTPKKEYSLKHKILHVGRISFEKNIEVVLEAMKYIDKKVTLTVVGDGPALDQLKEHARKLNLQDRVDFIGRRPYKKLNAIYQKHDCFVTASTIETQGLVLVEAAACGLPLVGVRKLAIPEIATKKNGFIAKPGDAKKIAQHVNTILSMSITQRKKLGQHSRKLAEEHDLEKVIDTLEELYLSLLPKKKLIVQC